MAFRRKKVDNSLELLLATGMIVSDQVVREVRSIYNQDYIDVPHVRSICDWAIAYFEQYGKAPGKHIQDIVESHIRSDPIYEDEKNVEQIKDFLSTLNAEYERADKFNAGYVLDEVEKRFKTKSYQHLAEDMLAELAEGNTDEAEVLHVNHKRVARQISKGFNPYDDLEGTQMAFEHAEEPLFKYPGYYGKLINSRLTRGGLVARMGKAKVGKTFTLVEDTYRALRARCNVVVFALGDLTEEEMRLRFHIRRAGRSNEKQYCGEMYAPVMDCKRNQDDSCNYRERLGGCGLEGAETVEEAPEGYKPCDYCLRKRPGLYRGAVWYVLSPAAKPLGWREAHKMGKRFMRRMAGKQFRCFHHPTKTASVVDIEHQLDMLLHFEQWVPDVVVIDYADILADQPGTSGMEVRHKENEKWMAMRKMAQQRHVLVMTASQTDAASYYADVIKLTNFNEDRRKFDHCTAFFGINQTADEKRAGITRTNVLLARQGEFDEEDFAVIPQCLQKGQAHIGSYKLVHEPKKKKKDE